MTAAVEQRGAPRGPDGRFRNPWPDSEPHGWRALLAWNRDRRRHPPVPSPPQGGFPVVAPTPSHPRARADELTATWIGHSTVLLQLGGLNLITDPVFSERAFPVQWMGPRRLMAPAIALEALPPLDLILISHSHYDHLDRPAVRRLARAHPDARWVVPLGLGRYIRGWGARGDHRARLVAGGRRAAASGSPGRRPGTSAPAAWATATGRSGAGSHWRPPAGGSGSPATPRTTRSSARSGRGSGRSTWS